MGANMTDDNETKPNNGSLGVEKVPEEILNDNAEQTPATYKSTNIEGLDISADKEEKVANYSADDDGNEKAVENVSNISEAEGQVKKLPYPKAVFFIISNEFCERFNYYGLRTVLVLYLSRQLGYSDDDATVVFHIFTMFVYFLCVFGAIISDSWLGKFKTILYLSLVYVVGSAMVAVGAIPTLNLPAITFTMIGLALVALGSGGIKPCVAAFGGDQFKLPEQVKQVATYFSLFYFSINSGSLISTTITPILREDVHCFGEKECYSLAFGVPAILMAVSIVIFVIGRPLYKIKPPAGNMVVLVSKTIGNAISTKWRESKTNPRDHWLDYADKKYDKQLIEDVKVLIRVLVLYLPLPLFWALFDQQGSRWTLQATRMDGDMGSWDIKPDQIQMLNPLLILAFIPLYDIAFYPALNLIGIRRPLQKLTLGGIFAGIAFVISGIVELQLEKTYPVLPGSGQAQLRIFNGELCDYTVQTDITGYGSFDLNSLDMFVARDIEISNKLYTAQFTFTAKNQDANCFAFPTRSFSMEAGNAYALSMSSLNDTSLVWFEDSIKKPSRGSPLARTLANVQAGRTIKWEKASSGSIDYDKPAYSHNLTEFSTGEYSIWVDDKEVYKYTLKVGGVYSIIITEESQGAYRANGFVVTEPNSVSILWLIPQYVVMTLGEVMFSVTGLEFSYAQAPMSMKSVLQACWLLTVAFGNIIVIVIAELSIFDSQAYEFFLFAGLMFVDMLIFMFVAYRYKPNDPIQYSETEPLTAPEQPEGPNGFDNINKMIEE